jgi:hypothetical protein
MANRLTTEQIAPVAGDEILELINTLVTHTRTIARDQQVRLPREADKYIAAAVRMGMEQGAELASGFLSAGYNPIPILQHVNAGGDQKQIRRNAPFVEWHIAEVKKKIQTLEKQHE